MSGSAGDDGSGLGAVGAALLCALALSGCADSLAGMSLPSLPKLDDINPFAEKEVPLPGKRVSVIQQENVSSDLAAADRPIALPPQRQNDSWTQPGGVASNAPGHLALGGAVKSAWSADAGTGSSFYGKLTAQPDRLRRQGLHARCGGQGVGLQRVRRIGGVARLDHAAQREGPGRLRRRPRRGRRPHLRRHRLRLRGGARCQDAARSCGRRTSARRCAPRRRPPAERVFVVTKEGQVYLPVGLGRHRAVDVPRHGRARQPALQRQPRRRRRHRRRALSDRRPGGAARLQRPADVVGIAGAHAHGLVAGGDERHGAAGRSTAARCSPSAMPAAWWRPRRRPASGCGR